MVASLPDKYVIPYRECDSIPPPSAEKNRLTNQRDDVILNRQVVKSRTAIRRNHVRARGLNL